MTNQNQHLRFQWCPEQIFEHPKKDRTRRFIKRLKVFETIIDGNDFDLAENIDAFALETEKRLDALNISEDDILQTRLSLETVLLAWYENGASGQNVTVKTFKRSGRVYVNLLYAGPSIDPRPEENKNPLNILM